MKKFYLFLLISIFCLPVFADMPAPLAADSFLVGEGVMPPGESSQAVCFDVAEQITLHNAFYNIDFGMAVDLFNGDRPGLPIAATKPGASTWIPGGNPMPLGIIRLS